MSFEQFRTVVRQAITEMRAEDPPAKQRGSFGYRGVNVLDVNSLRHLRFRAVVVLGLSERSFPPPPRQDALLLDHERAALNERRGWEIPLRAGGPDQEPLQFALAIHAASDGLQLSFARTELGDQRASCPRTSSAPQPRRSAGKPSASSASRPAASPTISSRASPAAASPLPHRIRR